MYEKACLFLVIVLYVAVMLESRVIVPPTEDGSSGNEEIPFTMNPFETETCGPNEVYSDCVNPCNDCQTMNIVCSFLVCNKGCDCRRGYMRNNQRICIPVNQCLSGKKLDPPAADDNYNDYYEGVPIIRRPPYNDYNEPDMDDDLPGTKPERFPSGSGRDKRPQENPKGNDGIDKTGDENINKPLDKEDSDEFENNDKDLEPSLDKDKPIHKDGDESKVEYADTEEFEKDRKDKEHKPEEENPEEEKREEEENEKKPDEEKKEEELDEEKLDEKKKEEELDEEKLDEKKKEEEEEDEERKVIEEEERKVIEEEERKVIEEEDEERKIEEEEKHELETDDDTKHVTEEKPIDDDNEEENIPKEVDEDDIKNNDGIPQKGDAGFFTGGSIFDTPFFNVDKVKKYFSQLDRALGHVFRQTMDEALLLNGTYANTTEEEVDIDGKKYIVTKSVIKGADNHSSMYIESLSARPKVNDTEEMKDIEIKNLTQT